MIATTVVRKGVNPLVIVQVFLRFRLLLAVMLPTLKILRILRIRRAVLWLLLVSKLVLDYRVEILFTTETNSVFCTFFSSWWKLGKIFQSIYWKGRVIVWLDTPVMFLTSKFLLLVVFDDLFAVLFCILDLFKEFSYIVSFVYWELKISQ